MKRFAAVLTALALLGASACAMSVDGQPVGEKGVNKVGDGKKPDQYTFPENNSGFAQGEIDQPDPVPGFNWRGWDKQASGRCAWVPAGLFDGIAVTPPGPAGHFCSFFLDQAAGDAVQITWGGSFTPFDFDPIAFMEPATIAGLQARVYDLKRNQDAYPGSCQVEVNTRSVNKVDLLVWNQNKKPIDRTKSCQTAKTIMERIVKAMVPLAGGKVWDRTPQQPVRGSVSEACKLVTDVVTTYAVIEVGDRKHVQGKNDMGTTCLAQTDVRKAETLLTNGPDQGLAQVQPVRGAQVTEHKIGLLPARQEIVGYACAYAVEVVPGRLLRIQYRDHLNKGNGCMYARTLAQQAVSELLEDAE
ncbi:hypothetical protein DMH04_25790 [Kibdelosporangium aridum]|uniref:DUF3558 domain-containing protein n=1 Tax=Kibdelosporangium aridum TaxID=2030 RepID=A0A428Z5G7_KIBAR|nr:hypothetical protein [Kibdelosporangium aridum]RSM82113.1 hypothetical protein DMH04_25790 [Kibdelosporangium aridum]